MNRKQWLAAAVLAAAGTAYGFREGDSQLWLTAGAETGAGKEIRIGLEGSGRWGDSWSEFFYGVYEPYVQWRPRPWFELTPSCEFIRSNSTGEWLDEQVPKLTAQLRGEAGPLVLANRSRMEYRLREDASDEWRYRDRVRLQWGKGFTSYKLRPYLEDELYFSCDAREFNENRAAAGVALEPRSWLKAELYYMARSTLKNDEWTDSNIVGLKCVFLF